jgi:uncharacterized protein (TIGR02246 family)
MSSAITGATPSLADEDAVRHVYQRFETAFRQGDVEGMATVVAEDAVFVWDDIEVLDRTALTAQFAANVAGVWKGADATHTIRGVKFLSPEVAMAWGSYAVVLHDGSRMHGQIMNTFIKRNGQWLIVSEQTSSAPSGG